MKELEDLARWKKSNRPTRGDGRNYHHIKDHEKRRVPSKIIEQALQDMLSGEFRTIKEICAKNGISRGSLNWHAKSRGVQFMKKWRTKAPDGAIARK